MAEAKYNSAAHRAQREYWAPIVAAGEAYCSEPICKMGSRWIAPGSKWHVSHDPSGTVYIGPSHARCNTSEGATRGNRQRRRRPRAQVEPPARRWAL